MHYKPFHIPAAYEKHTRATNGVKAWQFGCDDAKAGRPRKAIYIPFQHRDAYDNGYRWGLQGKIEAAEKAAAEAQEALKKAKANWKRNKV